MTTELPWTGLANGSIDARRVDRDGNRDFFWALDNNNTPALLLRMTGDMEELHPLPKIRSLDICYRTIRSGKGLVIGLRDKEQVGLFATLCRDVVAAGESSANNQDALDRTIRRTLRWHHLLRGGRVGHLSIEEQRGLVGELHFLRTLCDLIGPRAAIEAWKGPEGSAKDFEIAGCCVEVKARRGAARPYIRISSEDQLADVDDCILILRVCDVNAAVKPVGQTLTDHVQEVDTIFRDADMISYAIWETTLAATGFDFEDDYSDRRWTVGKLLHFQVDKDFPRIIPPMPSGVVRVRYSVSLDACRPFEKHETDVETLILQEVTNV